MKNDTIHQFDIQQDDWFSNTKIVVIQDLHRNASDSDTEHEPNVSTQEQVEAQIRTQIARIREMI